MKKKIMLGIIMMIIISSSICLADDKIEEVNTINFKQTIQTASSIEKEPKINARAAVVIDRNTKEVLYGKNETSQRAMASTTKIMTAMVVIQNTNLDNIVTISKKAAGTGGSRLKLKAGDKISVKDLLYGLMLRSGNDAAVALAEYVGGSTQEFAELMNQNAENIGLANTHFITPHGLDSQQHYTTAYELAILADYALQNEVFSQIVNTKTATITINGVSRTIHNTNELLGNLNGVYGVKTGFTNGAGRCLVTSIKRENLDLICVVLGADTKKDRTRDSINLIEYTFKNYKTISLRNKIEEVFKEWNEMNYQRIEIEKGENKDLSLRLEMKESDEYYPIKKGTEEELEIEIQVSKVLKAPVEENTPIGKLMVYYQGNRIKEIPIINSTYIPRKRVPNYLLDFVKNYDNYLEELFTKQNPQ